MYISFVCLSSLFCVITAIIDFDKTNQAITSMLNHPIPWDTIEVSFMLNSLTHVPAGYFKNLPNLDRILLSMNLISDVDDFAFSAVPTVTDVYLGDNELSLIRKNMFAGLFNLFELRLNSNRIHTVEPGSFNDNNALYILNLNGNSLQTLSECVFDPANHPTNLAYFSFASNPIQCDQSWCWVKQAESDWIHVDNPQFTKCDGPVALHGRKWDTITAQDLDCNSTGQYYSAHTKLFV